MKKHYLKEPRYVTMLAVWVPSAESLIEIMRYESCYPRSEVEAHKISRLIRGVGEDADHIIRLTRAARTEMAPNGYRCRSFGAFVLEEWHPEATPPTDEALAHAVHLAKLGLV